MKHFQKDCCNVSCLFEILNHCIFGRLYGCYSIDLVTEVSMSCLFCVGKSEHQNLWFVEHVVFVLGRELPISHISGTTRPGELPFELLLKSQVLQGI